MGRHLKGLALAACLWSTVVSGQGLMTDPEVKARMYRDYELRSERWGRRIDHFAVADTIKSADLQDATKFLVAYAPLSDMANLDGTYFRTQAALALEARETFVWGKSIPSDVFMHFVLPYRVNNENPDSARAVFMKELLPRIQGMSMYDAALEVNHWCHEKVSYKSTDERTSAPLATVKTAYGRCGEESTFTVAAMRSVGIPARQVYTPRWAHTDDNHAWVEVWIDGKWYFMGACEPDPELNMGWFAGPATRAIMMHTNTFGPYAGQEKTLISAPLFSKLNLLSQYAPVKTATVKVVDTLGQPMAGMQVDFQVYNYAEFYSFATFQTDGQGMCSVETGFGDLMIWVSNGKEFTWKPFPYEQESALEIVFDPYRPGRDSSRYAFQMLPPMLGKTVLPSTSKKEENDRRLIEENAIRAAYEATFPDTLLLRERYKNDLFGEAMVNFILKSRGNHAEIASFYQSAENKERAVELLSVISEKDLRDTPSDILLDHLQHAETYVCRKMSKEIFTKYVLNPRIGRELLSPWRSELQKGFNKKEIKSFRKNPETLAAWINDNIKPDLEDNYYGVTLFPGSVMRIGEANVYSRNVFFVACCRSFGIPARLEPATYIPQFFWRGKWISVFRTVEAPAVEKVPVVMNNENFNPVYYTTYTIAKLTDGRFQTLDYENDESMNVFPVNTQLEPGIYRAMTGNRFSDGSVLAGWEYLVIPENKDTVKTSLCQYGSAILPEVLFSFKNDFELSSYTADSIITFRSLNQYFKKDYNIIALIDPSTEPGRHFLTELKESKAEFDKLNRNIFLVLPKEKSVALFDPKSWPGLPDNVVWLSDSKGEFAGQLKLETEKDLSFPEVLFIANGAVYYHFSGYHINTAAMLLNAYNRGIY